MISALIVLLDWNLAAGWKHLIKFGGPTCRSQARIKEECWAVVSLVKTIFCDWFFCFGRNRSRSPSGGGMVKLHEGTFNESIYGLNCNIQFGGWTKCTVNGEEISTQDNQATRKAMVDREVNQSKVSKFLDIFTIFSTFLRDSGFTIVEDFSLSPATDAPPMGPRPPPTHPAHRNALLLVEKSNFG